jgi:hypothetical protein
MFQTSKCSTSGRFVHAVLWYFFMHPYNQSGRCRCVFDTVSDTSWHRPDWNTDAWKNIMKLHVQIFLRLNTWTFGTCQRWYNWIKSLKQKVCILLVLITYVYHTARFVLLWDSLEQLCLQRYKGKVPVLHQILWHRDTGIVPCTLNLTTHLPLCPQW